MLSMCFYGRSSHSCRLVSNGHLGHLLAETHAGQQHLTPGIHEYEVAHAHQLFWDARCLLLLGAAFAPVALQEVGVLDFAASHLPELIQSGPRAQCIPQFLRTIRQHVYNHYTENIVPDLFAGNDWWMLWAGFFEPLRCQNPKFSFQCRKVQPQCCHYICLTKKLVVAAKAPWWPEQGWQYLYCLHKRGMAPDYIL